MAGTAVEQTEREVLELYEKVNPSTHGIEDGQAFLQLEHRQARRN